MILKGDCIEVMKAIKPNSVDAVVTDPPYGLEFMGKEWDKLYPDKVRWKGKEHKPTIENKKDSPYHRSNIKQPAYLLRCVNCDGNSSGEWNRCKCESPQFKVPDKVRLAPQLWHTQWLTEAYRVLKPGGSMLVMGGTRTSHRLACAIEDSGFIIKDTLMFLYGSGFPKAQDLGKMIDKRMGKERTEKYIREDFVKRSNKTKQRKSQVICGEKGIYSLPVSTLAKHWDGFKVGGIKPAYEPIIWAVKPPEGSYVDNVLKHGVGAVNVDECRVGVERNDDANRYRTGGFRLTGLYGKSKVDVYGNNKGRFPANVILSHHPECVQVGMKKTKSQSGGIGKTTAKSHFQRGEIKSGNFYANKDGYEQVESWDCHPDCPIFILDEQSGNGEKSYRKARIRDKTIWHNANNFNSPPCGYADNGGASRFFKVVDLDDFSMYNKMLCKYNINGNISENQKVAGMLNGVIKGVENSIQDAEQFGCGKNIMENSPKDLKHIILVLIRQMIELKTLLSCLNGNIENYTEELEKTISSLMELNIEDAKNVKNTKNYLGLLKGKLGHIKDIVRTVKENLCGNGKKKTENTSIPICENIEEITRFRYTPKASRTERNAGLKGITCTHPTVKPISLFEYLIKLVTRQGQIILDPFLGSGTTAIASHNIGRKCVGIEKEDEYLTIAKRRIDYWENKPKQMEMGI